MLISSPASILWATAARGMSLPLTVRSNVLLHLHFLGQPEFLYTLPQVAQPSAM